MKGHFFHKKDLEKILDNAINKTLGDVDVNDVFNKTITNPKIMGIAGDVIEQSVLGFPADSYQRPDLNVDGVDVELKTTGIRLSKKGKGKYEAKEPMTITAVSPQKITKEEFENSKFWHKLERLLLVYYHYSSAKTVKAKDYADFYIRGYEFYEFNEIDKARLKNDWELVRDFIREIQNIYDEPESQYARISSELRSKLAYIDIAPKWPNKPRFRLKRQVVTEIVQNYFGRKLEKLPEDYTNFNDIDNKCHNIMMSDENKTVKELIIKYKINVKNIENVSKSINEAIIVKMFGGQAKKMSKIELFNKFGLIGKSITITSKGNRTEDIKLFTIDFEEWLDKDIKFKESKIYDYFANHQFLCMIFEEPSPDAPLCDNVFLGFKRFSFSDEFIQKEVKKIWKKVREIVWENKLKETICLDKDGKPQINKKTKTIKTSINFPKSKNNIIFLRGSGNDSRDKATEINGIRMYRHNVWIKGSYIVEELNKIKLL